MKVERNTDEQGNTTLKIYDNDGKLIADIMTKVVPDCEIPMPPKKRHKQQVLNSLFYLPNYGEDLIQSLISNSKDYFERRELDIMREYLDNDSTVIDIGANIGNHTLYFANECKVKKVYAFEPVPYTYKILEKNVIINNLEDRVIPMCLGMSDKCTKGVIKSYDLKNLGGTNLMTSDKGKIKLVTLDSLKIKEKIDLIKIDVENMDYQTLLGAKKTIKKNKPVIVIESFEGEQKRTFPLLEKYGYKLELDLGNYEYIFVPEEKIKNAN